MIFVFSTHLNKFSYLHFLHFMISINFSLPSFKKKINFKIISFSILKCPKYEERKDGEDEREVSWRKGKI